MTAAEAAKALNVNTVDLMYRYARAGVLRATKVDGRWIFDPASVEARRRSVEFKRSSKSNAANERAKRMAAAEALFAPKATA